MLPSGDPNFLNEEFCSHAECSSRSHFLMSCKGLNCSKKIHLSCTGFPKGSLKKDVDCSNINLHWYCNLCQSRHVSMCEANRKTNEGILEALSSLNGRIQNHTSSLDVTANHVDDLTDSLTEMLKDIRDSVKQIHVPAKTLKEINDYLVGPLTCKMQDIQDGIISTVNARMDKLMVDMEGKMNRILDNFTSQFSLYFSDLSSMASSADEVKKLTDKVNNLSDNFDIVQTNVQSKQNTPLTTSPIASTDDMDVNEVEIIENRIDDILNSDSKKPSTKKYPAPQPPNSHSDVEHTDSVKSTLLPRCAIIVSNLAPDTKMTQLKNHLLELTKVDTKHLHLKKLTSKQINKPKYLKYLVSAPLSCAEHICRSEAWDDGITIKNITISRPTTMFSKESNSKNIKSATVSFSKVAPEQSMELHQQQNASIPNKAKQKSNSKQTLQVKENKKVVMNQR